MSTPEPFGPWVDPMIRAKAVDPRTGRPSWNQLAIIAGVGTTTLTDAIRGAKKTSAGTVKKLAVALRVEPGEISEWLNLARRVGHPYEWPAEADLLTPRQRKALTNLIRSIVADEQEGGEEHAGSAPTSDGPSPVTPMPRRKTLPGAEEVRAARKKD